MRWNVYFSPVFAVISSANFVMVMHFNAKSDFIFSLIYDWGSNVYALKNGMTYTFLYRNRTLCLTIDINGAKPSNLLGNDGFFFILSPEKDKLMPYCLGKSRSQLLGSCLKDGASASVYSGITCASLIIHDGWEINYPW